MTSQRDPSSASMKSFLEGSFTALVWVLFFYCAWLVGGDFVTGHFETYSGVKFLLIALLASLVIAAAVVGMGVMNLRRLRAQRLKLTTVAKTEA